MTDLVSFVPPATSTGQSAAASASTLADNFDTFLTILTAQIQNQDPLEPLDSTQFTEQLVQFSGVEQQIRTNQSMESLIAATRANAGASLSGKDWVKPLNDLNGAPVDPAESTATAVGALIEQVRSQLADPGMSFQLMLPDDETSIESRTEALTNWCNGFLSGLSLAGVTDLESLGEDAVDFVRDLTQIARAGLVADANLDADENALFEITEYARVGSVLVYETLRGPVEQDNIH